MHNLLRLKDRKLEKLTKQLAAEKERNDYLESKLREKEQIQSVLDYANLVLKRKQKIHIRSLLRLGAK